MKNIYLPFLICLVILFQAPAFGQIKWSVGADIDFLQDAKVNGTKTAIDTHYFYRYDSIRLTYEDTRNIELYNKYSQLGKGFKIHGNVHIPISKKLNLVTGLGIDFMEFYMKTVYTKVDLQEKIINSVKVDSIPNITLWNINYPKYSINDPWRQNDVITLMNLYIPIEFDFEIYKNLRLFTGGKLNKTIYSKYNSYQREFKIHTNTNPNTQTTYTGYTTNTKTIKDHSGDAIKPISLEGFLGIKYRYMNRYELTISASRSFTSITRTPQKNLEKDISQDVDFQTFKPIKFSLGLNYFFNGKKHF